MEKPDKVIAGLEHCCDKNCGCDGCPYYDDTDCENQVVRDAVELLRDLSTDNQRLREMWADAVLEKSRVDQERAFYMQIADTYRESEPVVHAHNLYDHHSAFECSACGFTDWDTMTADRGWYNYCPNCGAHMDEEVADG